MGEAWHSGCQEQVKIGDSCRPGDRVHHAERRRQSHDWSPVSSGSDSEAVGADAGHERPHDLDRVVVGPGRVAHLEAAVSVDPAKVTAAMGILDGWSRGRGLHPSETAYVARTRGRRPLRFSESGDRDVERAYRTHWFSPELSERERSRLAERQSRAPDLVVISPVKDWTCAACGGSGDLLIMEGPGPHCMTCAELDHLAFLPAGSAALTRRAKTHSGLSAVVVRFSRSRRRYERRGILVEEDAIARAERECLADADARARGR
jgi:hypothetical protein